MSYQCDRQYSYPLLTGALLMGVFVFLTLNDSLWSYILFDYHFKDLIFIDWYAITAASDAFQHGYPVFEVNPYDYLNRPHVYPGIWLYIHTLGLDRFDGIYVGALILVAFVCALIFIVRPTTAKGTCITLLFYLSPPFLLAMERLNNDVIIFLLIALVPVAYHCKRFGSAFTTAIVSVATMLKYYPIVLFPFILTLFGFSRKNVYLVTTGAIISMAQIFYAGELLGALTETLPHPFYSFTIGCENLFRLFDVEHSNASIIGKLLLVVITTVVILTIRSIKLPTKATYSIAPLSHHLFLIGAILIGGCYALRSGFSYRLIFTAFSLPLILSWIEQPSTNQLINTLVRIWVTSFFVFTFGEVIGMQMLGILVNTQWICEQTTMNTVFTFIFRVICSMQWVFITSYLMLSIIVGLNMAQPHLPQELKKHFFKTNLPTEG